MLDDNNDSLFKRAKCCRLEALDYDEAKASSLEAEVERETQATRQCKEQVDELSSGLASECSCVKLSYFTRTW